MEPLPTVALFVADRPGPIGRAQAILPRLRSRPVLVSTRPLTGPPFEDVPQVRLDPGDRDEPGLRPADTAGMAEELSDVGAGLLVVDGPLEIALLGSALDIPTVPVRRPMASGSDPIRALAARVASWLAPYPAALEPAGVAPAVARRVAHVGLLSRHDGRRLSRGAARRRLGIPGDARHVTILAGRDGFGAEPGELDAAVAAAPLWSFSYLGHIDGGPEGDGVAAHPRLHLDAWCEDPFVHLAAADVAITSGSLCSVADVAAARRPLAVIPRPSDTDDEVAIADGLEALGVAAVMDVWPPSMSWPALLSELLDLEPRPWRGIADGRGATRAATWIDGLAASPPERAAEPSADDEDVLSTR